MTTKRILAVLLCTILCMGYGFCRKGHTLYVMSYNIRAGMGLDEVKDLKRQAGVINRQSPDYVGLQEVDSMTRRSGNVAQAEELAKLTGMHAIYAPAIPHQGGKYGIAALVKKLPLRWEHIPLPGKEEARTLLILEYEHYILCNVHMSLTKESQTESIELIRRKVEPLGKPIIFTGDFNIQTGTDRFRKLEETWTLLSDSTARTFPADTPSITIDFIWGLKGYDYHVKHRQVLPEPVSSDHRPLCAKVKIK